MTQSTTRKSGWTDERRAKHAAAIRRWAPWTRSTGPRTAAGKARAAQNAYRHGGRAAHARLVSDAVRAQNTFLRLAAMLANIHALRVHKNPPNELLARLRADFVRNDHIFYVRLLQARLCERLCKNLAFPRPLPLKVNANDNADT